MKQFSVTDIKVDNLSIDGHIDKLKLAAIEQTKSDTAVDVFVYDTSLDSDAGAWRKRTSHTSWYNETLNTSTRGSRREFPAVAVIVAETNKVTIYDGDDPDLPMWMVINQVEWTAAILFRSVTCINATMVIGNGSGITVVNFINEKMSKIHSSATYTGDYVWGELLYNPPILVDYGLIIHNDVKDVAMTVLPDAPIDTGTGLPVPTIAVATISGVSVIKHDGSVVDIVYTNQTIESLWLKQNRIWITAGNGALIVGDIPNTDKSSGTASGLSSSINGWNAFANTNETLSTLGSTDTLTHGEAFGSDQGLNLIYEEKSNPGSSLVAYTTSTYNTGWMPGDIKLATLSDTTVETVGVDESTEYVVNGTFSGTIENGDFTAWDISEYHAVSDNNLYYDGTGVEYGKTRQRLNGLVIGQQYKVSFDVTSRDIGTIWVVVHETGAVTGHHGAVLVNKLGRHEFNFVAATENDWIVIQNNIAEQTWRVDNISVKPSGELITNGTFDNNTGVDGWANDGMATFEVSDAQAYFGTNSLHVVADSNTDHVQTSFPVEAGKTYVFTAAVYQATTAPYRIRIGDVASGDAIWNSGDIGGTIAHHEGSWKVYNVKFTATGSESEVMFAETTPADACNLYIDAVSVRLEEPDRSVNDNGLQIFGEIDKTPVAPGADLVAYSGFSANNYLMQSYNSDLDFGTGDFCVMGWLKKSGSFDYQVVASYGNGDILSDQGWVLRYGPDSLQFRSDVSGGGYVTSSRGEVLSSWLHVCCVRSNNILSIYENGSIVASQSDYTADLGAGNDSTFVFGTNQINDSLNITKGDFIGSLALWRISKTAPTAEQIAKIYRDEKVLFQDGAQATLDGTSDAVTALAHDSATDLLHVGTSSGTSVFSGLQRVTSDTEPVTTCIDAQDELVVKR